MIKFSQYLSIISIIACLHSTQASQASGPDELFLLENSPDWFDNDPLDQWQAPDDFRFSTKNLPSLGLDWQFFGDQFKAASSMRKEFIDLQQKYISIFNHLNNLKGADFLQLGKNFSEELRNWVAVYIRRAINDFELEKHLAVISFGSLGRGEAGPVTDFEAALVWDPNFSTRNYQSKKSLEIANLLARSLEGLIGHPSFGRKGFRLDESEASPFHLAPWAQKLSIANALCWALSALEQPGDSEEIKEFRKAYFPFEGTWAYASRPKSLAALIPYGQKTPAEKSALIDDISSSFISTAYFSDELKSCRYKGTLLSSDDTMRNQLAQKLSLHMRTNEENVAQFFRWMARNRILVFGNKTLFQDFERERETIFSQVEASGLTQREELALKGLNRIILEFEKYGDRMLVTGVLPESTDLKRNHYRFEEQFLTNLGLFYDLSVQNTGDILKELKQRGIFGLNFANGLYQNLNQLTRLRWKEQIALGEQLAPGMNFLTQKAHQNKLAELTKEEGNLQEIIKKASTPEIEKLLAQQKLAELKTTKKKLSKLLPLEKDSILGEDEISLLRSTILPTEVNLLKRLREFVKSYKNNKDRPSAFSDDFKE